ncbi:MULTISPECIES: hypothetical protein [Saliphagus]|uniref:Tripartite tricarboxylate transporter TctB family protein n=1 Tax=Saliphagus infecundisoli TaxID=1849069 RepID=A0ABD5Q9K6_9EURY|nr:MULTISPECIES: hypothetical protein [Saliphagus]
MVVVRTAVVLAVAVLGALAQAAITVRWYEPPTIDDREPNPLFEAGLFFVVFGVAFAVAGYAVAAAGELVPPYSRIALLALTPIGYYAAYACTTGRMGTGRDRATRLMGAVSGAVVGTYPIVLLAV